MNKKYTIYGALTCGTFIIIVMVVALILDICFSLDGQLVLCILLLCAGCIPLWLVISDAVAQLFEINAQRRKRRKLIVIPYKTPTRQELPIVMSQLEIEAEEDLKIYKTHIGDVELRRIITDVASEADTQIYSIKKTR